MFDTANKSTECLNLESYLDKVLGCWTGKNIGGTLGAPFENTQTMNDAAFFTGDIGGKPIPNDDLDLQLVWLQAIEERGLRHVNERVLAEYWVNRIIGPWNEYGVCRSNIRNGLLPPLSGSCNNERWKYSNGAWIRSEIWACIFPGSPDEAAQFAWYDACCDHCGEGIYAELFTATLESAAFVLADTEKLIEVALTRIPEECRVARAIRLAVACYRQKLEFAAAREAIVADSADLGWFQAPGNLGFVTLGLLYGEGDFERSIVLTNRCGDDTDCTAGTVGAILGIIHGRKKLPEKWTAPIGDSIQTCSIERYLQNTLLPVPATLQELTERVADIARTAAVENRTLVDLSDGETRISPQYLRLLEQRTACVNRLLRKSSTELTFDLPWGWVAVDYPQSPYAAADVPLPITVKIGGTGFIENTVLVRFELPENWECRPAPEFQLGVRGGFIAQFSLELIPRANGTVFCYLPLHLRVAGRFTPYTIYVPIQQEKTVNFLPEATEQAFFDARNRIVSRINSAK